MKSIGLNSAATGLSVLLATQLAILEIVLRGVRQWRLLLTGSTAVGRSSTLGLFERLAGRSGEGTEHAPTTGSDCL